MTDHTTRAKALAADAARQLSDLKAKHEASVKALEDHPDHIQAALLPHMQTLYAGKQGAMAARLAATFYDGETTE